MGAVLYLNIVVLGSKNGLVQMGDRERDIWGSDGRRRELWGWDGRERELWGSDGR